MPNDPDAGMIPKGFDEPAKCGRNLYRGTATGKATLQIAPGAALTPAQIAALNTRATNAAKRSAREFVRLALKNKCPTRCGERTGLEDDGSPLPIYRDPDVNRPTLVKGVFNIGPPVNVTIRFEYWLVEVTVEWEVFFLCG